MNDCYVIGNWIFTKKEDTTSGAIYHVVDNHGREASRGHLFQSVDEMKEFVRTDGGLR